MRKFIPILLIVLFFVLMAVGIKAIVTDESPIGDTVILLRDADTKKSSVSKTGAYCTVAWYRSIESLMLYKDGTIKDRAFRYKWTLYEWGSDQDKKWFDANCKEPPN